jgi:hypothetical protein
MLMRISLIVAIIAGLAVGTLNFLTVKEKIVHLQTRLDEETKAKVAALADAASTHKALDKTTAELKTTKQELAAATEAKDKAVAEAATQGKRAEKLSEELAKTQKERQEAQGNLAAYEATGFKPQEIINFGKKIKGLETAVEAGVTENKLIAEKLQDVQTELDRYKNPEKPVLLPSKLLGKVLVLDPKWNFVVLDVGRTQGLLKDGELLVNRNGRLVAKVVVRSLQKDRSIANVMPGWQLGDILEGDTVIPAHPAS